MRIKSMSWLAILLVLLLTAALVAGCGGGQQQAAPAEEEAETEGEEAAPAQEGPVTVEENYPTRTIEVINQFGPGGGTDIFVRGIAVPATKILRQSIVPISVTGGGGVASYDAFLQAPADGYTLRAIGPEQVVNHVMGREDLAQMVPVIRCQFDQSMLLVSTESQFKTIQDVVDYAKANPGKLTVGGTDAAGYDEVLVNLWAKEAGIEVKYVPFAAASEANAAILGGHIDVIHEEAGPMKALIDGDKVRPLVIFMEERADMFPDVPTGKELGWEITIGRWRGFAVKVGTPEQYITILYEAFAKAMEDPIYKTMEQENLLNLRSGLLGPEEFKAFIEEEVKVYDEVLRSIGLVK